MSIFDDLRLISSTLDKERLLKKDSCHRDIMIFQYAYNPELTYGVNFKNLGAYFKEEDTFIFVEEVMFNILSKLISRELTGNAARDEVERFASKYGDIIKYICNKDLDCGVSVGLLERVFGKGFLPVFKVQLATEVNLDKLTYPLWAQIKYNGVRVVASVYDDAVILKTRTGKEFSFPILEQLLKVNARPGYIYDGELTIGDSSESNHTEVSGLVTSSQRGTPITKLGLVFNVFDCMSVNEFYTQKCDKTYKNRYSDLCTYLNEVKDYQNTGLIIADNYEVKDSMEADNHFASTYEYGFEGLILKSPNHKYTFKRSKDWVKIKAIKDCDLLCIGIEEGSGKYQGAIGALICRGLVEGKEINAVCVGSGLSDSDRYEDPSKYIGKTIEIKYNEVIYDNRKNSFSLFLPRYVIVRGDK